MVKIFGRKGVILFLRNDAAGVSLEYVLLVFAVFAFVTPSMLQITEAVQNLFAFVGSLIR